MEDELIIKDEIMVLFCGRTILVLNKINVLFLFNGTQQIYNKII